MLLPGYFNFTSRLLPGRFQFTSGLLSGDFQVTSGCDCCEVNGELVKEGIKWTDNGKLYGM